MLSPFERQWEIYSLKIEEYITTALLSILAIYVFINHGDVKGITENIIVKLRSQEKLFQRLLISFFSLVLSIYLLCHFNLLVSAICFGEIRTTIKGFWNFRELLHWLRPSDYSKRGQWELKKALLIF